MNEPTAGETRSARCRGAFGDRNGEVGARRQIAELEAGGGTSSGAVAQTQWLLARALERAGQFDEAADAFTKATRMLKENPGAAIAQIEQASAPKGNPPLWKRVLSGR